MLARLWKTGSLARALVIGAVLISASNARAAIELRATVDRDQVSVGERLILTIEASGAQNVPAPNLDEIEGFQTQYAGPSTQMSFTNGHMSSSISHRYALFARQAGQFTLGPFGIDFDGQHYETPAIAVTVTAQSQRGAPQGAAGTGNIDVRVTLDPVKVAPFVGERIPIVVTLYVGNVRVDQLQYPQLAGEGFVLDKWKEPTQSDEVVNGRRYRAVRFESTLTPLRPGVLQLTPAMEMALLRSRKRGDPFFDQFFSDAFSDREPFQAHADAVTVNVQPFPEAGKPAQFSGAVGQFDFSLDAKPTEVNAGDPITVRMEIKGQGNLDQVTAPSLAVDDRFRRYDPVAVKDAQGPGRRAYEQVVIPKTPDAKELPAVHFSFFDPATGSYRTITRGPIPITVHAAQGAQEAKIVSAPEIGAAAQRPVEQLGRDIVYIKDVPDGFWERGPAFFGRAWFIALQLLPPFGFLAAAMFARRRDRFAADPRLVRFRQAGRAARTALDAARQKIQADGFYDELAGAISGFLTAKLDLPPGAVERERVLERLSRNGSAADVAERITSLFALIERARYAPSAAAPAEREEALRLAQQLIGQLDRDRSLATQFGRMAALLALVASAAALAQSGDFNAYTSFFEGNAAYKAGRYADAATTYQSIHNAGLSGGALYFNLGNAHFKAGKLGGAVLSYERALRLQPRDADVRANLGYARELATDEPEPAPVSERLAFPLAERATSGELALTVSILWWLLWSALTVRALLPRFGIAGARVASVLGVLLVMVGTSFAARLAHVDLVRPAVVTATGETPVRFEPAQTGTQYFTLSEGVRIEVTEQRADWLQVRRGDGRRGWVPKDAVTEL